MNMRESLMSAALGALLAFSATMPSPLRADDTDLYVHPNYSGSDGSSLPLIMFSLDYRSNLGSTQCTNPAYASCTVTNYFKNFSVTSTEVAAHVASGAKVDYFHLLRWALKVVFSQYTSFKAALMMSHNNSNNCEGPSRTGCSNGGYILQGFRDMTVQANQDNFHGLLGHMISPQGNLSTTYQFNEMLFEFYRYLKGWGWYNAHNGWTDWSTTNAYNVGDPAETTNNNDKLGYDKTIESGANYISPFEAGSACTKVFAIHFMFGVASQDSHSDVAIKKAANATDQGMGLTTVTAVNMLSYMRNNDLSGIDGTQSITQYFVTDASSTTIANMAAAGGTTPVAIGSDPSAVVTALGNILAEILSVSTTFVSASVPVNVFNRSESLDNVFIALFQADEDKKPFWVGNVKKLKLKLETVSGEKVVSLVDSLGVAAIANDGRIEHEALTFWTDKDTLPTPTGDEVAQRDGRGVARGAAGQRIPGFVAGNPGTLNSDDKRKLFYDPTSGTTLVALNADAATATALTSTMGLGTDTTTGLKVLKWMRGFDPLDIDGDGSTTDVRPWIFGDPLHSRPLPINYGVRDGHSQTNPLIYVAVGSNDGYMRFIRNTVSSGVDTAAGAGEEVWAFMPRAVMPNIVTQYKNVAANHTYGVDGPPSSYTVDVDNDGTVDAGTDKVYLYFGLRRGGRAMYALDVSTPASPALAWRIDNTTTGFSELGYTFSPPKVGKINLGSGDVPIVAFAGGYSLNKDERVANTASGGQSAPGDDDTYGNSFYVVNATTGALIFKAVKGASKALSGTTYTHPNLTDSIPSEIALVDADGDGYTDRAVFGDTGGQVWRVDMASPTVDQTGVENWRITLLADLGRHYNNDVNDDRRFFHRPDVVPSKDTIGNFDAVVIGSGDRENPLDRSTTHTGDSSDAATPVNYLYVIKDRQITPYTEDDAHPAVLDHLDLADVTDNCLGSGDCTVADLQPELDNGWRLELEVGPGEKSLSSPLTVTNTVFFTTFLPLGTDDDVTTGEFLDEDGNPVTETATCGPQEGRGLLYAINLADATPVKNFNVTRDSVQSSTGNKDDRHSILASAGIPADVVGISLGGQTYVLPPDLKPSDIEASTRWRTFWYQVDEDDGP